MASAALAGLIQVSGALSTLITSVLLARTLGAAGLGVYAPIVALSTVLALFASSGVPVSVVKILPETLLRGNNGATRGVIRWAYSQVACNCCIVVALLILADAILTSLQVDIPYIAPIMGAIAFLILNRGILQGLGKPILSQLPEHCVKNISLCIILLSMAPITTAFGKSIQPRHALLALFLSYVLALTFGGVFIFNSRRSTPSTAKIEYEWRRWTRQSLLIMVANLSGVATTWLGLLLLPLLVTHDQVGLYRVAQSTSAALGIPLVAANVILGPRISRSYAADKYMSIKRTLTLSARLTTAISSAIALFLLAFGRPLIQFAYGAEFIQSYSMLMIMLIGQIVSAACGSIMWIHQMAGQQGELIRASLLGLVLQSASILFLSTFLGAEGAAIGDTIAVIIMNIYLVIRGWKTIRVDPSMLGRFNARDK